MRHQSATVHELARIELLAGLPGEMLARLGERMIREELAPGARVASGVGDGERFYVVLSGLLRASGDGGGGLLRPGSYFGATALAAGEAATASAEALTPAAVASCDRETFDELVRPLFSEP